MTSITSRSLLALLAITTTFCADRASGANLYLIANGSTTDFTTNANSRWKTALTGGSNPTFGTGALDNTYDYILTPSDPFTAHKTLPAPAGSTFVSTLTLQKASSTNFTGILQLNSGGTVTFSNGSGLIMDGGFIQFNTTAGPNVAGSITLAPGTLNTFQSNSANLVGTVSANISGDGGVQFTRGGGGNDNSAVLFSGNNTYAGDTNFGVPTSNGITLRVGSATAIPFGAGKGNINMLDAPSGTLHQLDLNGIHTNINGLNSLNTRANVSGRILAGSGAVSFTLGNGNANGNFGGTIINGNSTLSLTKTGSGKQTLTGVNTYTGVTNITGGILEISGAGSINSTSGITINGGELNYDSSVALNKPITFTGAGGTVSGDGTISSAITVGNQGKLAPGNSPGTQNFTAGMNWADGGTYEWEINDALGGPANSGNGFVGHDFLNITGALDMSGITTPGGFTIEMIGLNGTNSLGSVANFGLEDEWILASATGGIVGFNSNKVTLLNANLPGDFELMVVGNNLVLQLLPIPEPSTGMLMFFGLVGLLRARRANRHSQK